MYFGLQAEYLRDLEAYRITQLKQSTGQDVRLLTTSTTWDLGRRVGTAHEVVHTAMHSPADAAIISGPEAWWRRRAVAGGLDLLWSQGVGLVDDAGPGRGLFAPAPGEPPTPSLSKPSRNTRKFYPFSVLRACRLTNITGGRHAAGLRAC